ncbi:MAG: hypothetical protein EZS28_043936 [Streblomastix strix]|uniref:Uncharacterized protein n=1 Tax=Streblomastix strix TaxID=222440 RepID=A0A5J4TPZ7_9EUKA|nr:MAG: hypothetical protein EZS28_043936 [Streblomastix strix]
MTYLKEYNVEGGLIGLGEFILLEIVSESIDLEDDLISSSFIMRHCNLDRCPWILYWPMGSTIKNQQGKRLKVLVQL